MNFRTITLIGILVLTSLFSFGQKRKADKDTREWRYELEAMGKGAGETEQFKVWTYSKDAVTAMEQAKKNAIHGLIFRGVSAKDRFPAVQALVNEPNAEVVRADFFDPFFDDGGQYLKYVSLVNNGSIGPGDRIKVGKEYKIGVVVTVDKATLRKDLEASGIIKKMGGGF